MALETERGKLLPAFVAAVVVLAFALACPPADKPGEEHSGLSEESKALFRLIPDGDYFLVGYIDLDKFAESRFGTRIIGFSPSLYLWDKKLGITLNHFHQFVFASLMPREDDSMPDVILMMSSSISEEQILKILGKKLNIFKKEKFADTYIYNTERFSFAFPEPGIVAIGSPELVVGSLRLASGEGDSFSDGESLRPFELYLERSDALWLGVDSIDRMMEAVTERQALLSILASLRTGFIGINFAEDADVRIFAECGSEEDARDIASGFRGLVGIVNLLINNEDFNELPAEWEPEMLRENLIKIIDSVDVSHQKRQLTISFTIPETLIDYMVELTGKVMFVEENAD